MTGKVNGLGKCVPKSPGKTIEIVEIFKDPDYGWEMAAKQLETFTSVGWTIETMAPMVDNFSAIVILSRRSKTA